MAKPIFKSERQIQADILAVLIAELGLNDVNAGSVVDVLTQAIAQEDFNQHVQVASLSRLLNLDETFGEDLDAKAFEYDLTRGAAQKATGQIVILKNEAFTKVATTIYSGLPAPLVGDNTLNVDDASHVLMGTSGTLIIGRGTANVEEVTYSVAPVNNTNYYTFTLDSLLTNDHSTDESVILKQDTNEVILAGTSVRVPSSSNSSEVIFSITEDVTLLAGEEELVAVNVIAVEAGTGGNIPLKAIKGSQAFITAPFAGARAENRTKFTSGRNRQSDDELRDAIKSHIQSLSKGVLAAIINAVTGLVDPESAKRVVSTEVVSPINNEPVRIYIDDGTGFEPSFQGIGFEEVLKNSTGGDLRLQLDLFPLVKAQLLSGASENYDMSTPGLTLIYTVENKSETITFDISDFEFPENATAEEIVAAINDKASIIEARTANSGSAVVIQALTDTNESLQVTGGTANAKLLFPTTKVETLYLYKNDKKLSKDGVTALLEAQNSSPYNLIAIGAFPHTLTIIVDGKSANVQTVTFQSGDFTDTSACTVAEIVKVINDQLAGATAQANSTNSKVQLLSNTLLSSNSKLQITGGSANNVTNGLNFSTTQVVGINKDYIINKQLGTIELTSNTLNNDSITAGNIYSRAHLRASLGELYAPSVGQTLVISVDGGTNQTITFDASFAAGKSAEDTADFINLTLEGGTAYAREVGTTNYLEISTNTYTTTNASLEIKNTSTANPAFGFTLNDEETNEIPHKAFTVSQNAEPYTFVQNDSLITIVDGDVNAGIFSTVLSYNGVVSGATSTTVFANSSWNTIFTENDELIDYFLAFTSGPNTVSGSVATVSHQGGNTWRYVFSALPVNLANIAINDLVSFTNLTDVGNNGFFIITAISTSGTGYVEVTNVNGVAAILQTGTALLSQRKQITDYVATTGTLTVGSAFTNIPAITNTFIILPSTINNLLKYLNNKRITSLSTKATIEGVEQNTKLQISSKKEGSDGKIQVSGGTANSKLMFPTAEVVGLQAYNQYTGLIELVNKTIYGDDTDLVAFPGVGAAGVQFEPLASLVKEVAVALNVTLAEGVSLSNLENAIKSQVINYVNNLGIGKDVVLEEIRSAVIGLNGVIDVEITNLSINVPISFGERARTRSNLIVVG